MSHYKIFALFTIPRFKYIILNVLLYSPVEILDNLKKIQRNLQFGLFYAEFYGEFNGASCHIFSLGRKKLGGKTQMQGFCAKSNVLRIVFSNVGLLKLAITIIKGVEYLHEAGQKTNICIG